MQKLIYINKFTGSAFGTRQNRRFTYRGKINLHSGANRIALLSVAVGLPVSLLLLFSSANCFFFVSLILIHLFLKPEECGWTLWVMEYWNLGTSGFARVVSRETWSVMAKMDLPGVLSFPSDSSSLSVSTFQLYNSVFIRWGWKEKLWILRIQPTLPLMGGWMRL